MKLNSRNLTLDIVRAIGIIAIVVGHSGSPITHFVYLFHIAVFIIVSGYFWKNENSQNISNLKSTLFNKIKKLYIPYIILNIIAVLLNNFLIDIKFYSFDNHYYFSLIDIFTNIIKILLFNGVTELFGATWFLRLLFVIIVMYSIIDYILQKKFIKQREIIHGVISVVLLILGYFFSIKGIDFKIIDNSSFMCYYLFYFGNMMKNKNINLEDKKIYMCLIISFIMLLILNLFGSIEISKNQYTGLTYFVLVSMCGWYFVYGLAHLIMQNKVINKIFQYIGKNTMSIFILHLAVFKLFNYIIICIFNLENTEYIYILLTGNYWWILYTVIGIVIPLLLNKGLSIIKGRMLKDEIRSNNCNI